MCCDRILTLTRGSFRGEGVLRVYIDEGALIYHDGREQPEGEVQLVTGPVHPGSRERGMLVLRCLSKTIPSVRRRCSLSERLGLPQFNLWKCLCVS